MFGNFTLPLIGTILIYFLVLALRNVHFKVPLKTESEVKILENKYEDRHVDISDSRLSNFGSNSQPRMDSSEHLVVDRVIPLTETLNKIVYRILKRFSLNIQLEDKVMIPLANDFLNFSFTESHNETEVKRTLYGMNAIVIRLDTLQPLGNAFISEDSDQVLVVTQRLRFQILKCKYDFCDSNLTFLGTSSLICNKNTFVLNIKLSTNYDNSKCKIDNINLSFTPNEKSCYVKVEGLYETKSFNDSLKSALLDKFISNVVPSVIQEVQPLLTKAIQKENICSYFNVDGQNLKESTDSKSGKAAGAKSISIKDYKPV